MRLGAFTAIYARKRGESGETSYIEQMQMCKKVGFDVQNLCMYYSGSSAGTGEIRLPDWEARIHALREAADKEGVVFSQTHAPGRVEPFIKELRPSDEEVEHYKELLRRSIIASSIIGAKWVTVHPFNDNINGEQDVEVNTKTNIEFYSPYVELAKKHGVGLAIENMARFPKYSMIKRPFCMSAEELSNLIDAFGDEAVGATWDFGHANMVMRNQPAALRILGKRLKATHVQDCKGIDAHLIPFIGGNIKWEEIMPVLVEIGYEGDFILESASFMKNVPVELWETAGKFAYEMGSYCMSLCNKKSEEQ